MPARNPDEVDVLFQEALNSGDVDAIMDLYEPDAGFVGQDGQVATGQEAIRAVVQAFVDTKPSIDLRVERTVPAGNDLAVCYGAWTLAAGGQEMTGKSIEVVRRQPDGTWRFAIDDPWARGT